MIIKRIPKKRLKHPGPRVLWRSRDKAWAVFGMASTRSRPFRLVASHAMPSLSLLEASGCLVLGLMSLHLPLVLAKGGGEQLQQITSQITP